MQWPIAKIYVGQKHGKEGVGKDFQDAGGMDWVGVGGRSQGKVSLRPGVAGRVWPRGWREGGSCWPEGALVAPGLPRFAKTPRVRRASELR